MKTSHLAALLGLTLAPAFFSGCATIDPNSPEIAAAAAKAGFGEPPAATWQETIKDFMELRLKDPSSAQYKFGTPEKGWITKPPISGGGLDLTGWMVAVAINAKNSYGGYTGYKDYRFLWRDGRIIAFADYSGGIGFWQHVEAK